MHTQSQSQPHMPIDDMTFQDLDRLRQEIGLSQSRLCQRGEINPASYSRWRKWVRGEEGGCRPHPRSLVAVRDVIRDEMSKLPSDALSLAS